MPGTCQRMNRIARRLAASRSGSIAVEFGFIAPVIIVMMLGILEISAAISTNLSVQAAARAGLQFGFAKPPVQGDVVPVINAVKAAMPSNWTAAGAANAATVTASVVCECENTGAVACGGNCAAGENKHEFLKVDVTKPYKPFVTPRYFSPNYTFRNSSQMRLK